jgi:S1-C subfamily serine protease
MKARSALFKTKSNKTSEKTDAVVPLITTESNTNRFMFLGTAFYISNSGILLTAKHCLFNKDALFTNLGVIHFLPDNKYILRPIKKITISNEYDIAYLLPETIFNSNNELIGSDALVITNSSPKIGDQLGAYAYPDSKRKENKIDFISSFYLGECKEFHKEGFSLLKSPCYQTSIHIKCGASGGPVFDRNGKVFGVCSTGYDLGTMEEPISFVTPIGPTLDTTLEDGEGVKMTIQELIDRNIITLE